MKSLRGNGHSFPHIATVARCDHFICIKIFTSFKKLASFIKNKEVGDETNLAIEEKIYVQSCKDATI